MIKGKNICLRMFDNLEEIKTYVQEMNQLEMRSEFDHTELTSQRNLINAFQSGQLWSDDYGLLQVILDQKCIGTINYKKESEYELSIGYRIVDSSARGKGYGYEMVDLFVKYLFNTKPISRISLYTAENNMPSRKLAEKCGFTQEGILRQAYFYRGIMHNWVIYGLLRGEI